LHSVKASGVTVSSDAKCKYELIKKDKKFRFIIFHIKDEKVIEVESTGERNATYADFYKQLNQFSTECRYCVFDFPVNVAVEGSPDASSMFVDRLVLLRWSVPLTFQGELECVLIVVSFDPLRCPENAKVKQKMLYSASYDALKRSLVGIYKYVQACEFEEATEREVEDAFRKAGGK
jgi:cofilin